MRVFRILKGPFAIRPRRLFSTPASPEEDPDPKFTYLTKLSKLRQLDFPSERLNLAAHLSSLPYSDPLAGQSKTLEDLLVQYLEAKELLMAEKEESEEYKFYQGEVNELEKIIEEEYERILAEALQANSASEVDKVEGAILEFRGGVGGAESLLFAEEMSGYYQAYLAGKGYRTESISSTDHGGKVVSFRARGQGVYKLIIHESGVHKVIRVPETESKGRLHSSVISIVVLPDVPFEFRLNDKDLRYEYMRAQGPGGQHVNKTESACRLTHIPTGISVMMQDDRVQENNKRRALELMREKLYQIEFDKKMSSEMAKRKSQIGTSDRSDKIRTYNFPQDRITDHRLGKTVFGIQQALSSGSIFDECIEEMQDREYQEQLEAFHAKLKAEHGF